MKRVARLILTGLVATALCIFYFKIIDAQERSAQPLKIWQVASQRFDDSFSTRTVFVYKFQVGNDMHCYATLSEGARATITLGDVPCEK